MPSPGGSPFIPPLPDMPGSSPVRPPVIPTSPPIQSHQATPVYPQQYLSPGYATPFVYPMAFPPGVVPSSAGPSQPPPPPPPGRGGYSSDYVGYGNSAGPAPPPASAPPPPAQAPPGGTPYPAAAQFYAPPPPPPGSAQPGVQSWGATPAWGGWGYPSTGQTYSVPLPGQPPYGYAPPQGYWGAPMPGQPTPIPGYPMPAMGMYPPPAPPPAAPPLSREPALARNDRFDIVFSFSEGTSYGPALKPAHVQALGVHLKVNPLLKPVEDSDPADRKHLVWNMLFSSSDCHLSGDAIHRSWSAGRNEPATRPRVTHLRLISAGFPWMVDIEASKPTLGVTCGDLIDQLCGYLLVRLSKDAYSAASTEQQRVLKNNYHYNRSRADGVPGGRLGEGLKRIDWLSEFTMFGGVRVNDVFVSQHSGIALPCTLEVLCLEREEGPEPEAAELRARGRSRSRRNSRARSGATTPA